MENLKVDGRVVGGGRKPKLEHRERTEKGEAGRTVERQSHSGKPKQKLSFN